MTAKISVGEVQFHLDQYTQKAAKKEETGMKRDYWSLFFDKCKMESIKIQTLNWISPEDVMSISPTSVIAIPGVTIGMQYKVIILFKCLTFFL